MVHGKFVLLFPGNIPSRPFAFSINSFGYVGGGSSGTTPLSDVYKYNPNLDTWTTVPNLSGAASYSNGYYKATSLNNKAYIIAHDSRLYEYDPETGTSVFRIDLPNNDNYRYNITSLNSSLYLGEEGNFYSYTPSTNTFTTLASSASINLFGEIIGYNGYIYSLGYNSPSTSKYDVLNNTWSSFNNLQESASIGTVFYHEGYIYLGLYEPSFNNPVNRFQRICVESFASTITDSNGNSYVLDNWERNGDNLYPKADVNIGIGTTSPDTELHVNGRFKLVDGSQGLGKVLTSSGTGLATWQNVSTGEMEISNTGRGASFGGIYNKDVPSQTTDYALLQNDDGTTYLNSGGGNDLHFRANNTEYMTLTNGGNFGIGTAIPNRKLTIQGNEPLQLRDATGTSQWHLRLQGAGIGDLGFTETGAADDRLVLAAGGNVGIGTPTPTQAKLVVSGSATNTLSYGYLSPSGTIGTASGSNAYSIHASSRIAAQEFNAFSDKRIKKIKGVSNSENDLETLSKIEITDYTLIDSISKGNKTFKKVIAQQVKEIYPQAVTNDVTEVVPNIYKLSEIHNGWIALTTDLQVGDKVKLIFSESEELVKVVEKNKNSFKVNVKKQEKGCLPNGKVFVYGKQVNDFHTVDYEAISMLNVSATQELLKRIELLEEQNKTLSSSLSDLENRFSRLESLLIQNSTETKQVKN